MNTDTKETHDVSATGVEIVSKTGAAAYTVEELISTLAPDDTIAPELCSVARAASAMVNDIFPYADIDTQTLKLAEECDEMYFSGDTMAGLVDVAIVSLQLIYDYKSMLGLCTLRGALQESVIRTEEDWKEFLDACRSKISMNYIRNDLGFWKEISETRVTTYERNRAL